MPRALEEKLKREAASRGYGEKRTGAYVYGTMRKTGWKPSREKKYDELLYKACDLLQQAVDFNDDLKHGRAEMSEAAHEKLAELLLGALGAVKMEKDALDKGAEAGESPRRGDMMADRSRYESHEGMATDSNEGTRRY